MAKGEGRFCRRSETAVMSFGRPVWTEALVYSLLCCWLGLLTAGYNFRRRVGHVIYWGGLLGMRRLHGRLEDGRGVGGRMMDRRWPGRHRRRRFGHLPIFCSLPRLPWAILLYRCPGPCYPFGDVRLGEEAETPEGGQGQGNQTASLVARDSFAFSRWPHVTPREGRRKLRMAARSLAPLKDAAAT